MLKQKHQQQQKNHVEETVGQGWSGGLLPGNTTFLAQIGGLGQIPETAGGKATQKYAGGINRPGPRRGQL